MINNLSSKLSNVYMLESGQLIAGVDSVQAGDELDLHTEAVLAPDAALLAGRELLVNGDLCPDGIVYRGRIRRAGFELLNPLGIASPFSSVFLTGLGGLGWTMPLTGHIIRVGYVGSDGLTFVFQPNYLYYNWGDL